MFDMEWNMCVRIVQETGANTSMGGEAVDTKQPRLSYWNSKGNWAS